MQGVPEPRQRHRYVDRVPQPGAGRARAPLHRMHHLRGGGQRRRSVAAWRPRRSLHIFRALCRPGDGPAPSGAQRRLPPGGTLIGPLAALPSRKAPPYPRERRPGRVAHRRSGPRRARHARGQRDAGVPHAGGKPWAGPSGIRLAIPIGVPRGGGWLLNDRQSHKVVPHYARMPDRLVRDERRGGDTTRFRGRRGFLAVRGMYVCVRKILRILG